MCLLGLVLHAIWCYMPRLAVTAKPLDGITLVPPLVACLAGLCQGN
jgi:hypothetical protein